MLRLAFILTVVAALMQLDAQSQVPALVGAQFDVVSIKPHKADNVGGGAGFRTLPDGTFMMTGLTVWSILTTASPEPVRDVSGFPEWVRTERYDIIAKPAPGANPTREQRNEMMRNLLIERFKVAGHVEEQERNAFALVLARSDGKLGPQLAKSTLDCEAQAKPTAAPLPSPDSDMRSRCGSRFGAGVIEAGGVKIDQ